MNALVPAALGATIAVVVLRPKKKKSSKKKAQKAIEPPTEAYADPDLPDVIEAEKGGRFTIIFGALEGKWVLVSTPADGSVVSQGSRMSPSGGEIGFDFKAVKSGSGAVVFHLRSSENPDDPQPAADIVEIQVRVS